MDEQLSLLERPEIARDGMATALLLPEDLPELRAWIDEAVGRNPHLNAVTGAGQSDEEYRIWPHRWVLRDLVAALPEPSGYAHLVEARQGSGSVDSREVRALIDAVETALAAESSQ